MTYVMVLCLLNGVPEQVPVFTKVSHFEIPFPVALPLVALGFQEIGFSKVQEYTSLVSVAFCLLKGNVIRLWWQVPRQPLVLSQWLTLR